MDDATHNPFETARRKMLDAFKDLLFIAQRTPGIGWDAVSEIQGRFFDGNVEIKQALRDLAESPGHARGDGDQTRCGGGRAA